MLPPDAEALVRRYFACYLSVDRAAIEALVHPGFTFPSPRDDAIDRAAYFARCWAAAGSFAALDIEAVVPDGRDGCFVLYHLEAKRGAAFCNIEHLKFRDGLIASVEVFFGRETGKAA